MASSAEHDQRDGDHLSSGRGKQPTRLERVREVFEVVADLEGAEFHARLDEVCRGAPEVRAEIESLLAIDPGRFFGAEGDDAISPPSGYAAWPERIGPYEIIDVLGRGGMGIVYRARQSEPVEREVALKVLPAGSWSEDAAARFGRERMAMARMEHPGIARLLDAGSSDDGSPYFAMSLIRGDPIVAYCQSHHLERQARLRLFTQMCRAVAHAHQKGVLHRDLKPSNVLVTEGDEGPAVVVIDFGIAKSLEDSGTRRTIMTNAGQILGTLEYMSPEQARGDASSADVRSDVYSLGIILFELLYDRLPYDLRGLSLQGALRLLANADISTRTTASGAKPVDRDLRSIVLKCTEHETDRRYASTAALLEDVERYLRSEPILARPPSLSYQLTKLVKRHRFQFGLIATILLLLIGSSVVLSALYAGQTRERSRAETHLQLARNETEKAETVTEFLQEILTAARPSELGLDVTVREVLDEAGKNLEESFQERPEMRAAVEHTLGKTYLTLGLLDDAQRHLESAVRLREELPVQATADLPNSLDDLAEVYWQRREGTAADSLLRRSFQIRRLSEMSPEELARSYHNLAQGALAAGRFAEADSLLRQSLAMRLEMFGEQHESVSDCLNNLGGLAHTMGRVDEARVQLQRSLEIRESLFGPRDARTLTAMNNLATVMRDLSETEEAVNLYRRILPLLRETLGDRHPHVATTLWNIALCEDRLGRPEVAEPLLLECFDIRVERLGDDHQQTGYARDALIQRFTDQGRSAEADSIRAVRRADLHDEDG